MEKPPENDTTAITTTDQVTSLLALVMDGDDLGMTPDQMEKFKKLTSAAVTLQPGRLRNCDRPGPNGHSTCPMHARCPFIKHVAPAHRPYDRECYYEAALMEESFKEAVEYIRSMDPDGNEIPAVELGLCKDLAYQTVVEHRLSLYIAQDPSATQQAAIPGAGGATKKEENPAYISWVRAVDKRSKYQKELHTMVRTRLKTIEKRQDQRVKTIDAIRKVLKENRDQLTQTKAGSVFAEADEAMRANARDAEYTTDETDRGDKH